MNLVERANHFCQDYYQGIPQNTIKKVVESGVITFALVLLFTQNQTTALASAAVNATSSLVHSLATPFFRYLYGKDTVGWGEVALMMTCTLFTSSVVVNYFSRISLKIDLLGTLFFSLGFPYLFNLGRPLHLPLNQAMRYTPVGSSLFV